eukprot:1677936-Pyramimonas_sp.AAC.1
MRSSHSPGKVNAITCLTSCLSGAPQTSFNNILDNCDMPPGSEFTSSERTPQTVAHDNSLLRAGY